MATMGEPDRRQFLTLVGTGLAGAALPGLVSGCAPGGSSAGAANEGPLAAAFNQAINDLDPHGPSAVDVASLLAGRQIYDTLVAYRGDELVPSLAKSWEHPDPKTWVFALRDDVTFHDGTPLTSKDVKASLERLVASDGPQKPLWTSVESVETDGDYTVKILVSEPIGTMLVNLTLAFILPADKMDKKGFFRKPIGTGPFAVESFTPSSQLSLTAAKKYWGKPTALPGLDLPYIPETSTRMTSLLNGEVDVTWIIPPDQLERLRGADGVKVETVPSVNYYFTWFNCSRKPFTDARVRRAMWHALDVKGIVKNLYGDAAEPMDAPIPSPVFGYEAQEPYTYDPDLAKRELADAGYPDGFTVSMMWFEDTGPLSTELAQAFISSWSKIGVTVKPQQLEKATWIERLVALDWDLELQTNMVTTGDADYTLGRLYTTEANRMGYSNKRLDEVLNQAHAITDQEKRKSLYAEACKIIWEDAVGIFPAELASSYGLGSAVKGFTPAANNQPEFRAVSLAG